ncbi:ATP-binding protein [Parolsenella catena]|uniref:sensor histidine kinase n=1 Tax=Parolsenella catena TaxID=2003188 RepID=UPI002943204E|nr:ATP-binding protein [Parolsenella catena]
MSEQTGAEKGIDQDPTRGQEKRQKAPSRPSLARRFFIALSAIAAVAAIAVLVCSSLIYQSVTVDDAGRMLESECRVVRASLRGDDTDVMRLTAFDSGDVRVTLVGTDGTVLYDNQNSVASMPNHADRPEIAEALADGTGSAERDSETSGYVSVYRAIRLANGNVLRLAVDRDGAAAAVRHDLLLVCAVVLVIIAVCWAASRLVADRLVSPILAIDPAEPDAAVTYVEIEPLVERISEQVEELRGADLMRREFTSNVTHELKTPLSSISGASELIRDGIARPEDVPEFAGRIYDEAHHMTELVNDILTLSKLDESERSGDASLLGAPEPVNLLHVAREVATRLAPVAEKTGVSITAAGEACVVQGYPRLLDELVYNLCDNAIRYNHEGGWVDVSVSLEDECPLLVVADSGSGIPAEQQAKVFERFYRGEQSRSRETGGTGLGLAIVKHAATLHGAALTLDSEPGHGTTVCVRFPGQ